MILLNLSLDLSELLYKLACYFPLYVLLVLIPMIVRVVIERAAGIWLTDIIEPTYEATFKQFVYAALFFPLFEELVFRGLPLFLLGPPGLLVGSIVWVFMHPAWQLQYLEGEPLWKKLLFTFTCTMYYGAGAVFFGIMWLNGDGLCAIIYHMLHNAWLTALEIAKTVLIIDDAPWKRKYRYIKTRPMTKFVRRRI